MISVFLLYRDNRYPPVIKYEKANRYYDISEKCFQGINQPGYIRETFDGLAIVQIS